GSGRLVGRRCAGGPQPSSGARPAARPRAPASPATTGRTRLGGAAASRPGPGRPGPQARGQRGGDAPGARAAGEVPTMNRERRTEICQRLQALNRHPTTELDYATPFELLVAVTLSAQATDRSVNLATKRLFEVAPTPAAMLALGEEGLCGHIRTIG